MKAKKPTIPPRPNSGSRLSIVRRDLGNGNHEMEIQLGDAPVPERRYTADVAGILTSRDYARIIFGQTKIGSTELRSMLDIHFPLRAIKRFLVGAVKLEEAFKAMSQITGAQTEQMIEFSDEPSQTVALSANSITAALSGSEACMDYIHISPSAIERAAKGEDLFAEPVVRVNLSTGLMMAVIEKLKLINIANIGIESE